MALVILNCGRPTMEDSIRDLSLLNSERRCWPAVMKAAQSEEVGRWEEYGFAI